MNMGPDEELLFFRGGLRPIKTQKLPYVLSSLKDYADSNPLAEERFDEGWISRMTRWLPANDPDDDLPVPSRPIDQRAMFTKVNT